MPVYDVGGNGWLPKAWDNLSRNEEFTMVMSQESAKKIISHVFDVANQVSQSEEVLSLIQDLAGRVAGVSIPKAIPFPGPETAIKLFAIIGALGAMETITTTLAVLAHFRGYLLEVGIVIPPSTLDLSTCKAQIECKRVS